MKRIAPALIVMTTVLLAATVCTADWRYEWRHLSTVHNGSGVMSDNTVELDGVAYRNVSAAGQPGGIFTSGSGELMNHAGFLQAVDIKRPNMDTDGDGVIDELSMDNDGDGLLDLEEVTGSEFDPTTPTNPNLADTSGTGVSDFDKMVAGINPLDPDAVFQIINVETVGADAEVTWTARGNDERIYVVRAINDSYDDTPDTVIWSNTVPGGAAPWYETTEAIADPTGDARFYAVEVIKP